MGSAAPTLKRSKNSKPMLAYVAYWLLMTPPEELRCVVGSLVMSLVCSGRRTYATAS